MSFSYLQWFIIFHPESVVLKCPGPLLFMSTRFLFLEIVPFSVGILWFLEIVTKVWKSYWFYSACKTMARVWKLVVSIMLSWKGLIFITTSAIQSLHSLYNPLSQYSLNSERQDTVFLLYRVPSNWNIWLAIYLFSLGQWFFLEKHKLK